jgi:hypothetical protein
MDEWCIAFRCPASALQNGFRITDLFTETIDAVALLYLNLSLTISRNRS